MQASLPFQLAIHMTWMHQAGLPFIENEPEFILLTCPSQNRLWLLLQQAKEAKELKKLWSKMSPDTNIFGTTASLSHFFHQERLSKTATLVVVSKNMKIYWAKPLTGVFLQCLFKSTTLDGLIDFSRAVNI